MKNTYTPTTLELLTIASKQATSKYWAEKYAMNNAVSLRSTHQATSVVQVDIDQKLVATTTEQITIARSTKYLCTSGEYTLALEVQANHMLAYNLTITTDNLAIFRAKLNLELAYATIIDILHQSTNNAVINAQKQLIDDQSVQAAYIIKAKTATDNLVEVTAKITADSSKWNNTHSIDNAALLQANRELTKAINNLQTAGA